jgi:predicted transcriptional regulator
MTVREFAEKLDLKVLTGVAGLDREVSGVYICDLLSWVLSHASPKDAWITVHTHLNIVAVALMTEVSCIIVPEAIDVEEATLKKAAGEDVAILSSKADAYRISCTAYELGI